MTASGKYLYIAMDGCFQVVDITDPARPQTAGILNGMPTLTRDVSVAGNYAYVLTFADGITVVDISNPKSPALVKSLALPKYTGSFVLGSGYIYEVSTEIGTEAGTGASTDHA